MPSNKEYRESVREAKRMARILKEREIMNKKRPAIPLWAAENLTIRQDRRMQSSKRRGSAVHPSLTDDTPNNDDHSKVPPKVIGIS